jgi:hypothetical protein
MAAGWLGRGFLQRHEALSAATPVARPAFPL